MTTDKHVETQNFEKVGEVNNPDNKCGCGSSGVKLHSCPYESEINEDVDTLCNCCESCESFCGEEI